MRDRSSARDRLAGLLAAAILLWASPASGHTVYMMNSNHTDYNWNATAADYDQAMLEELDYYLQQIADTAGSPPAEQARYEVDSWWWLYLYEQNRPPAQFTRLLDAIRSGHISVPLNPFVTLYGAMPTEAVIRAGYYPGRMQRLHGLEFLLGENRENHTNPWGLVSLWAGSGARYTWKGVCGCVQSAPARGDDELFAWLGPDDKSLLFKWYNLLGSNRSWGGYSEARDNFSVAAIDSAITTTNTRQPGISVTGLFGAGWDDVSWQSGSVVDTVVAYNASGSGHEAVVSNGIDFFQALEASGEAGQLRSLRGGWGNDWDMWPASLAARTARVRRALERQRSAEALAVYAQWHDETFWQPVRADLESGLMSVWKYFEHGWNVTTGGPTLSRMQADKLTWMSDMETAVDGAIAAGETAVKLLFASPDEERVVVFNPLAFERTDMVQFQVPDDGPYVVRDVETGEEVRSQWWFQDGSPYWRFLASDVPPLGYRVYRWAPGSSSFTGRAAWGEVGQWDIESDSYHIYVGERGQFLEVFDKRTVPSRQLAGAGGMNDFGAGTPHSWSWLRSGPVSGTAQRHMRNPTRKVGVTLYHPSIDRIDIENVIEENVTGPQTFGFHANLEDSKIRFEEIGAIARPGLVTEGGDFLPGTRASRMTLNHFTSFEGDDYTILLANLDAFAMQVNDSTNDAFDLTGDSVHVVAMEQTPGAGSADQGNDTTFSYRFALRGHQGPLDPAEAMRWSLAAHNPLHLVRLDRNQSGPLAQATGSLLGVSESNVVATAFKPAEDEGAGFVVRLWELGGRDTRVLIDASTLGANRAWETTLIETDQKCVPVERGVIEGFIEANEIQTWRFTTGAPVPPVVLMAVKDSAAGDVKLEWSGGLPPWAVGRSETRDVWSNWTELTPAGGIGGTEWTDPGVLADGAFYTYGVRYCP